MIGGVLQLAEQPIHSTMTPRSDLFWIDLKDSESVLHRDIKECSFSYVIVAEDGAVDEPLGIIHKKDLADLLLAGSSFSELSELRNIIRQPLSISENLTVLQTMEQFRKSRIHIAFVVDEHGSLQGLVTLTDIFEAIASDMPENHEEDDFSYELQNDGSYLINGGLNIQELKEILGSDLPLPEGNYGTVAGIALTVMQKEPALEDNFTLGKWIFKVSEMDGHRVSRMVVSETGKYGIAA